MNTWNTVIFMKTNKPMSDMNMGEMSKWDEWKDVSGIWSTSGEWDGCIKLKGSSPDLAEKMVKRLQKAGWVTATQTGWWRQMDA